MAVPAHRRPNNQPFRVRSGKIAQNRLKRERKRINIRGLLKKVSRMMVYLSIVALVLLVGYEAYQLVSRASFFRLEKVEVSPLKRLGRDEVISQAGVRFGEDLVSLRLGMIGEQLAKNPWIEKVRIRRYLPNTLVIEISEQEPVAVASMGYLYYLNAKGRPFKLLTEGDSLDYPVLTGISEDDLEKDPEGSRDAIRTMLVLLDTVRKGAPLKIEEISEVHYDKGYGFTMFMAGRGLPIRLGRDGFAEKLERLARIYETLSSQLPSLEYIDLDYHDKIVTKRG